MLVLLIVMFKVMLGAIRVPDPLERPTLTVEEAADLLGISRASGFLAVNRGEIPCIRIGRRIVVPTAALRQMLGVDSPPAA